MARSFEQMDVWKESRKLVAMIYHLTGKREFRKDFGLVDQIRRAAVSVMSNIAEGFERGTNTEFIHFLFVAKGSCGDQKYLIEEDVSKTQEQCRIVSSLLGKLIQYLKRSSFKGDKHKSVVR